jgi:hypothetical protein
MRCGRTRIGLVLVVGWFPFAVLGLLLTVSIWLTVVGVPLLFFAGTSLAAGIRLLRDREPIRGQHAVGPLISSVVTALAFVLVLSLSNPSADGRAVAGAIGIWIFLLFTAGLVLLFAWRGRRLDPQTTTQSEQLRRAPV